MKGVGRFWQNVLSSSDPTSSKRLITLILAGIFIIAQMAIVYIAFYVIFYTTRGKVDKDLLDTLRAVLEYDFYIILSGLGFITADSLGQMLLEKTKAKIAGNVAVGSPSADSLQIEQTITQEKKNEPPVEPEPPI